MVAAFVGAGTQSRRFRRSCHGRGEAHCGRAHPCRLFSAPTEAHAATFFAALKRDSVFFSTQNVEEHVQSPRNGVFCKQKLTTDYSFAHAPNCHHQK